MLLRVEGGEPSTPRARTGLRLLPCWRLLQKGGPAELAGPHCAQSRAGGANLSESSMNRTALAFLGQLQVCSRSLQISRPCIV